jgi:hypothetical protein
MICVRVLCFVFCGGIEVRLEWRFDSIEHGEEEEGREGVTRTSFHLPWPPAPRAAPPAARSAARSRKRPAPAPRRTGGRRPCGSGQTQDGGDRSGKRAVRVRVTHHERRSAFNRARPPRRVHPSITRGVGFSTPAAYPVVQAFRPAPAHTAHGRHAHSIHSSSSSSSSSSFSQSADRPMTDDRSAIRRRRVRMVDGGGTHLRNSGGSSSRPFGTRRRFLAPALLGGSMAVLSIVWCRSVWVRDSVVCGALCVLCLSLSVSSNSRKQMLTTADHSLFLLRVRQAAALLWRAPPIDRGIDKTEGSSQRGGHSWGNPPRCQIN